MHPSENSPEVSASHSRTRLARDAWDDFRLGFSQFLAYDLLFKILASAALVPLATWVLARLISSSGRLTVGNYEIVSFLLTPRGIVTTLLAGTVTFGLLFAEQAGLVVMAVRVRSGQRASALEGLLQTARRFPALIGLGASQAAFYLLALTPFVALLGLAHQGLPRRYDINYLIAEKPLDFWLALAVVGILASGALLSIVYLYVRWIFSVPVLLLERTGPLVALRRSRQLVRGAWRVVSAVLLLWGVVTVCVPIAFTALFDWISELVLVTAGANLRVTIAIVVGLIAAYLIVIELVTLTGLTVNSILIARLYSRFTAARGGENDGLLPPPSRHPVGSRRIGPRLRLAAMAIAIIALTVASTTVVLESMRFEQELKITAHRGSSQRAPENTLSAIESAIADGADYAEIDVQETADGVVVLLHDEDLMRVARVGSKIWDISHADLSLLDVGSWFSPEFADERVPTLTEAIEVARGRIKLNIELKFNGHDQRLAERVVEILRARGFGSEALVSSLELPGLQKVRELDPDLSVGYMIARSIGDITRLDVDFLSLNRRIVTRELVASAQRSGKEVHVWTVDDPKGMSYFADLGVDNITTNVPATLRAVLEERAQLGDAERLLLAFSNWLRN
ncbi:MAG: glycerophosphoryl diester phosphodiesterase membrane domain-containing protein [Gemmatimonadota bacterium]|nr:MAG: glycerophosphoryl diester phosphodiesterase membrane domain-containing protein [Gemmatimonadota bacterium]